ncbi:MAG: segregation/condensation protein A [Pseudomonadota bacterium]
MPYSVKLKVFEGPLDLLLHLIKKNELDIFDIPIATITAQYLEYLDLMRTLSLDIAGEFLVMAATLIHIKSKMLLPPSEDEIEEVEEEEEDPRAELVRRLIEYQRFKDAANKLTETEMLDRDVFIRGTGSEDTGEDGKDLHEVSIIELLEAFKKVLEEKPKEDFFSVLVEKMSVNDKIVEIVQRMKDTGSITFQSLFEGGSNKREIILTFLALLELVKLRMASVWQAKAFGTIRIYPIKLELPEAFGASP